MKIFVITTSYNYEKYIKETIESVIAQTHSSWELIVIDDGSTDNSVEVIAIKIAKLNSFNVKTLKTKV